MRADTPPRTKLSYLGSHYEAIQRAAARLRGHVRHTPLLPTELDPALYVKPECLQVTGSFKARGAFSALLRLQADDPALEGVVAVSSGNHARAVAHACRTLGLEAVVVIPEEASPTKVDAARALGAEVVSEDVSFSNREERARRVAEARGLPLVHSFDDWDVVHGQGTIGVEIADELADVGVVAAPVGGGGLLSGLALALKARRPDVRIVGVEPEAAADAVESLRRRRLHVLAGTPTTVADGVRVVSIGERPFEVLVVRGLVDGIVTVSEAAIERAVAVAWTRLRLAIEPTAALPLAAYLEGKLDVSGTENVVLVLTGGNFDPEVVGPILARARDSSAVAANVADA